MPIVTDILEQKRSKGRFSVYVDDKYAFGLSDLDLSLSRLRVGQAITAAEVEAFKDAGEERKAYNWAIKYLSYRPRSIWEVVDYLTKKGVGPEISVAVVERLKAAGLLDDIEFARSWIANRQSLKPSSRWRLEQELMAKRVSREAIEVAMEGHNDGEELQALIRLIAKKQRLTQYAAVEKLMAYLSRQGYEYELIKKALERLNAQN